jgi:hypothetical protein
VSTISLAVIEFSRGLLDFLNQVQYQGQTLDIRRGKRVVARVLLAAAPSGYPLERLDNFLLKGPKISEFERQSMAKDVGALRSKLSTRDCS